MNKTIARCLLAGVTAVTAATAGSAMSARATMQLPGIASSASATARPVLDERLAATLATADPATSSVVFVHAAIINDAVRASEAAGLEVVERWSQIGVAVAAGVPAAIHRVAADPSVRYVEPNTPVEMDLPSAHTASRAEHARQPASGLLGPAGSPYDGTGVTIAVNDSGIDGTHPMFVKEGEEKVVRNLRHLPDCVGATAACDEWVDVDPIDLLGHGTIVASIAGGYQRSTFDGRSVRGVAPGAKLVGLGSGQVPSPGSVLYGVVSGLNWVLEHHRDPCGDRTCPPIRVVNNSWSVPGATGFDPNSAASKLSNRLVAAGVVVVFSAGNADGDGTDIRVNGLAQNPTPGVIGVANYDDAGTGSRDNYVHPSSSRGLRDDAGTYPDLSAPGTDVTAACTYPQVSCRILDGPEAAKPDPRYASTYGTSLAAPYVSGVVALLLQADPSLSPAELEHLLESTAHQFGPRDYVADPRNPGHSTSYDRGHGLVDVTAALATVLDRPSSSGPACPSPIVDPEGDAVDAYFKTGLPREASAKGLDVTRAWVSTHPLTGDLTFAVRLADLGELPPPGATGEDLRYRFVYDGTQYQVQMERLGGVGAVRVRFRLQTNWTPSASVADALVGKFDVAADTVWARVPRNAFAAWNLTLGLVDKGDVLSSLEVVTNRSYGTAFLATDTARNGCPYIVGS